MNNNWNQPFNNQEMGDFNQPNQNMMNSQPKPITLNTIPVKNSNYNQGMPQCIPGRVIHDISDIVPAEIPMDNTYATFIRDDYKEIYLKTWSSDGSQPTLKFVLANDESDQLNKPSQVVDLNPILERLDRMERKLNTMRYSKPKQNGGKSNV